MVAQGTPHDGSLDQTLWLKGPHMVAQGTPTWWLKGLHMVAQGTPHGGSRDPTRWLIGPDMVAQGTPHGGSKWRATTTV